MDPAVRAGDADRDRVADALRRHFAEGRLEPEEYDERLTAAFAARTMGQLSELVADLPPEPEHALPVPVSARDASVRRPAAPAVHASLWRAQLATYVTTCLICVFIWFVAGRGGFWPIWVIGPWGIVLLVRGVAGSAGVGSGGRSRGGRR